jgi:hypothetical protein
MRAELASIDERAERRGFVLSCTRAILTSTTALRSLAGQLTLLGFVAIIIHRAVQLPPGAQVAGGVMGMCSK